MLSLVGNPVAVNPDSTLRAHARDNGWTIRDFRRRDAIHLRQREADFRGEFARVGKMALGLLGEDHGGVAGQIAQRRILGRLHHEKLKVELRQAAVSLDAGKDRSDAVVEEVENVHGVPEGDVEAQGLANPAAERTPPGVTFLPARHPTLGTAPFASRRLIS